MDLVVEPGPLGDVEHGARRHERGGRGRGSHERDVMDVTANVMRKSWVLLMPFLR